MDDNAKYILVGGVLIAGVYFLKTRIKKTDEAEQPEWTILYDPAERIRKLTASMILNAKTVYENASPTTIKLSIAGIGTVVVSSLAVIILRAYYANAKVDALTMIKTVSDGQLEELKNQRQEMGPENYKREVSKLRNMRDKLINIFKKSKDWAAKKEDTFYSFIGKKLRSFDVAVGLDTPQNQEQFLETEKAMEKPNTEILNEIADVIDGDMIVKN
jgi:hypothetical protein